MIENETNLTDIKYVTVSKGLGEFTLEFIDSCVPEHPFYVRWINHLGGWEYHMFGLGQGIEYIMESQEGYFPFIEDSSLARVRDVPYRHDGYVEVYVIEEQISKNDFDLLKSIQFSPFIQWYNTDIKQYEEGEQVSNGTWIRISCLETSNSWNTKAFLGNIELTFRLPKLYTQLNG